MLSCCFRSSDLHAELLRRKGPSRRFADSELVSKAEAWVRTVCVWLIIVFHNRLCLWKQLSLRETAAPAVSQCETKLICCCHLLIISFKKPFLQSYCLSSIDALSNWNNYLYLFILEILYSWQFKLPSCLHLCGKDIHEDLAAEFSYVQISSLLPTEKL